MQIIEERLDQLEKRNRRLTAALVVMAVAICAVVTMAFSNDEMTRSDFAEFRRGDFELLTAKIIFIKDDNDTIVMSLGKHPQLRDGQLTIYSSRGTEIVRITGSPHGLGTLRTFSEDNGKELVAIHGSPSGAYIGMFNEDHAEVVTLESDTTGSGRVGVHNNWLKYESKYRALQPGP
jgi:hypothetical protein